ncbi:hypothetical protein [Luteolibacter soli]|uniref:Uncharacterized protein n=1 Tax=Luteolibacter soli TaxID=3135280 RepID=A0ABU9B094_9BACT
MKPDTPPSWQKLAAAGRQKLRRTMTESASGAAPEDNPIGWLPELGAQVHAGFLRQIWRRWTVAGLAVLAGILAWLLLADRLTPSSHLPSPRIPIPEAP